MPEAILPYVPEYITVHLGPPGSNAENVTVPFDEYIKNVTSSEIYPTWPENALRANIYAIITYALNRIYTEYYRSRGYDFDITNSTAYDQAFNRDSEIYQNISDIVDDIFDSYVVKQGRIDPYFTQFCNGTTSRCDGLSQWGTVELANQGLTPYEILQRYYGDDINIVENAPVRGINSSYPGTPLRLGESGNNVKVIQTELNRISRNYPAIPKVYPENGIFGVSTENAVKKFQEVFDLPVTGIVDKSTWYKIKQLYTGVKGLSDLISDGVTLEDASLPFSTVLKKGIQGEPVRLLQYYLRVLKYFNPDFEQSNFDGVYNDETENAVKRFQELYGLPVTGEVNAQTWQRIVETYNEIIQNVPDNYSGNKARLYPGFYLTEGMSGREVEDLQTYLSLIGRYYEQIPVIPVTGYFGPQTAAAVSEFQRLFGLTVNGAVGPLTWYEIAKQYDFLVETEGL